MNWYYCLAVFMWYIARGNAIPQPPSFCHSHRNAVDGIGRISQSVNSFSLKLYKAVANIETGSFALSTANVFVGLSQLFSGAEGLSQQQLSNALEYCPHCFEIEYGLQDLACRINYFLFAGASMDNAIFHTYKSGLNNSFINKITDIFGPKPDGFRNWEELRNGNAIYNFAENTGISHPYNQTIDEEKSLIVASAAKFSSRFVHDSCLHYVQSYFHYNDTTIPRKIDYVQTTIQSIHGELHYRRHSNNAIAQYIELTWADLPLNRIKTFLILPNETDGINELEKNINKATIREMLSNTKTRVVRATIPRHINIMSAHDLIAPLKNINLTEIFKTTTDFGKITNTYRTKVGSVLQQIHIDHEWIADPGCSIYEQLEPVKIFNANHAFIILTVFKDKNPFILSMARYT